jgi:hypothetical protein
MFMKAIAARFTDKSGKLDDAKAGVDVYEVRLRKERDGFDLISDRFRRGPIWYAGPDAIRHAVGFARYRSRLLSHRAIIRVLDVSGAVLQTHES